VCSRASKSSKGPSRGSRPEIEGEAIKARLRDRLETMAARLRASPDWRELTPAELAEIRAMVAAYRAGGAEQN
jgi:hypothetical protein